MYFGDAILGSYTDAGLFRYFNNDGATSDRLHIVSIDLSTAQRDLATDWISAYKRYFHTDRPIESM